MNSTDPSIKMPALARNLVDTNAVQVFTDWINSLPGTPALAPPTITPNGGTFIPSVTVTLQPPDTNAALYYTLEWHVAHHQFLALFVAAARDQQRHSHRQCV